MHEAECADDREGAVQTERETVDQGVGVVAAKTCRIADRIRFGADTEAGDDRAVEKNSPSMMDAVSAAKPSNWEGAMLAVNTLASKITSFGGKLFMKWMTSAVRGAGSGTIGVMGQHAGKALHRQPHSPRRRPTPLSSRSSRNSSDTNSSLETMDSRRDSDAASCNRHIRRPRAWCEFLRTPGASAISHAASCP